MKEKREEKRVGDDLYIKQFSMSSTFLRIYKKTDFDFPKGIRGI